MIETQESLDLLASIAVLQRSEARVSPGEQKLRRDTYALVARFCQHDELLRIDNALPIDQWIQRASELPQPTTKFGNFWIKWLGFFTSIVRFCLEHNRLPKGSSADLDEKPLRQKMIKGIRRKQWKSQRCPIVAVAWSNFVTYFHDIIVSHRDKDMYTHLQTILQS